ncbi:carbohydrate ABC transporter permease [Paenibacillus sp. UNC451MF]|uniref:carbohydrate ABC transporter permease n=1 Tax=Paenibacillus sp. UNC451MF TaxID=1449063 RepID=UPI000490D7B2|nr:carbohydrate ABC transporter permease [Paenibacillus sp. UNC451MF]
MYGKQPMGSYVFQILNGGILLLLSMLTLYPLWHELALSFSSMEGAMRGGFFFWPREFTSATYQVVLSSSYLWTAYANTLFVTAVGTVLSTLLTASTAYPLIKQGLPGKNMVTFLILFTMLFGGGLIPTYLLVKGLGLVNSLWSLILPGAISAFNVIIMRSFFVNLPAELEESAMIDGANPLLIFFKIILPLSMPVLSTVALWEAVSRWNNFFSALIYLNDKSKYTLPVMLKDVINGQELAKMTGELTNASTDSVIAATIVISILPIICVYPFLQKYFVKGVMIGAVKS